MAFLQAACPRLHLRWPGFRKVRKQVCKRIDRRLKELGLADARAYGVYLDRHPDEWRVLDSFCRISISRFYRDRAVFDRLRTHVMGEIAGRVRRRGETALRCWSAGCASGEEPYSLSILWRLAVAPRHPGVALDVTATDADAGLLRRAEAACYPAGCLKDLPPEWADAAFEPAGDRRCLRAEFRAGIEFRLQDIRREMPAGPFDLVMCRNLAFTYFDSAVQERVLLDIARRLRPGGYLVIGGHESLPPAAAGFSDAGPPRGLHRRDDAAARGAGAAAASGVA